LSVRKALAISTAIRGLCIAISVGVIKKLNKSKTLLPRRPAGGAALDSAGHA